MAKFNEILVGRYNRALQKQLGIKGEPPSPQLTSEITPILELDKLPLELRFLHGWRVWAAGVDTGPSAGNLNGLRLRNPVGSGVVGIIEKATFNAVGAAESFSLQKQFGTVDLTTPFIAIPRDVRGGPASTSASVLIPSFGNPAATAGGLLFVAQMLASTSYDFITYENQEIVLAPGDSATIYSTTVNVESRMSFWWRERALEEGELA